MAYPGSLDSFTTKTDGVTEVLAAHVNDLQSAIVAIETELGTDPAGTLTDLKTRLVKSLSTAGNLQFAAPTTLTISAGEVTVTQNYHVIDTEAAGAADDLDTISGGADGMVLVLRQANDARDVTIKHATGNIRTTGGGDILLTSRYQAAVMVYDDTLSTWLAAEIHARIHDINGDDHTGQLNITAGCLTAPTYTDNGSGNITVDAVPCAFFPTDDFTGKLVQATIGPLTETLTDGVTNYVVGDYNGGSPVMDIITDVTLINSSSVIPIYTIVRTGSVLHTHSWDEMGRGLADKLNRRLIKTQRYARESGLATSETGTRNLVVSAGVVWEGQSPVNLTEVATATDKLILCYHSGGVWTQDYTQTAYNNTQYDNGTNLATLTSNRYAVNWVYRGVEDQKHVYITLGTGNYTLTQAQAATVPTPPSIVTSHAILIAKIIVQKSSGTALSIQSAFDTAFTAATATAHNDLTGLQGGTAGEYYHLTSAQVSALHARAHDLNSTDDHTGAPLGVTMGGTGTTTQMTTGSVLFAGASGVYSQDNANLFWDDTNNRLGIGTASPASGFALDIIGGSIRIRQNGGYPGFVGFAYGAGAVPLFKVGAARGTATSPSTTQAGDVLGSFQCAGYYGGFITASELGFVATENWSSTGRGANAVVYTTKIGATSEAVAFTFDGAPNAYGAKAGITAEGGFFVRMTAGESLARGEVVASIQGAGGADGKVWKCPTSGNENDMPLGVVYADASANAEVWIITSGIAYVLPTSGVTATRGYVLTASTTTAGRVDQAATVPAAATHFKEVGHFIDTGSGNGAITRAIVHFN